RCITWMTCQPIGKKGRTDCPPQLHFIIMKKLLSVMYALAAMATAFNTWAVVVRTVSSTADDGSGSLRKAIADSNPGDTIVFAVSGTIILTNGELPVIHTLT